jgi:rhamnose transport system permease protein
MLRDRRALGLSAILALLLVTLLLLAPRFFALASLRGLAVDHAPLLIAAFGATLVILVGQIDVSVGAVFAAAGVAAGVLARAGLPVWVWAPAAPLCGLLLGLLNGVLVAGLRIPSLVVTLAALAAIRGALRWCTGGSWIQELPAGFQWFGLGQDAAQTFDLMLTGLVLVLLLAALRWTHAGRTVFAVGCDAEAARLLGARPWATTVGVFAAAGALTGLAALLGVTRYPTVEVEAGTGLELAAISASVLGGASIRGGRGSLAGTVLGVMFLAVLAASFVFLQGSRFGHVEPAWERAAQGVALLLAVAFEPRRRRHAPEAARG